MDNKKQIKCFITYICDWIEDEYKNTGHDGFLYNLRNDEMSYLIADKGIEKRIEKQLLKRGLKAKVEYTLSASIYKYLDGEFKIVKS